MSRKDGSCGGPGTDQENRETLARLIPSVYGPGGTRDQSVIEAELAERLIQSSEKGVPMSKKQLLNVPVDFSNVSIGDKTAGIHVSMTREKGPTLNEAAKTFCNRRITGKILAKPEGSGSDQAALPGMEDDAEIVGSFDTKALKVTDTHFSLGLTFMRSEIDVGMLARFAKRAGKLIVNDVDVIPDPPPATKAEKKGDGDEDEEGGDDE